MNKRNQYLQLSSEDLETVVRKLAQVVINAQNKAYPNATDRNYINRMLLKEWEDQIVKAFRNPQTINMVEVAYRIGSPISVLVQKLVEANGSALKVTKADYFSSAKKRGVERVAFKSVVHLFAFRRAVTLSIGKMYNFSIVHSLPRQVSQFRVGIDSVLQPQNDVFVPISWVGTQPALAALLLTLQERGYISDLPSIASIKKIFANVKSIDQAFRPGLFDGQAQYPGIGKSDFFAFSGIKNKK